MLAYSNAQTNCFHDFFPGPALARAQELDAYFEKHKAPVGPLHGLPVSLKDQCRVIGRATHMGYTAWVGKTDSEMSVLTQLLWNAGAVFYVKTSVPQSLMVCETINNIIGRTTNPRNKNWSCGGSSGGEGALIGFRGGVIGVGTDIGRLLLLYHPIATVVSNRGRWFDPSAGSLQLSVWSAPQSWPAAICKNGKQHAGPRDYSQCLWSYGP